MLPADLFGIYLHWPYCRKICPYCDFNVYAAKSRDPAPLVGALTADLSAHARLTADRRVTSIYFGGGTPSLIPSEQISVILSHIDSLWPADSPIEVTLEANPEDVTVETLRQWKAAGINRLSLGIQALDDEALRFLGRAHTREEALSATEAALSVFDNVSIDMIYARPGQSIDVWLRELETALATGAPHLSLYELTIKEKTAFQKQVERMVFEPLDEDAQADLYLETLKLTAARGLPAYEVSNHAKSEAHWSRHNLTYWQSGEWLGIGPGAEGRINLESGRTMTRGARRPADYMASLANGQTGWEDTETLPSTSDANERLIMGLRSKRGVDRGQLAALYGEDLPEDQVQRFISTGHLVERDGRLILTEEGWLLADYIAVELSP